MKKIMIKFLRKVKFKFQAALSCIICAPLFIKVPFEIEHIGTEYGGWWFAKTKTLKGSKVVFCGAERTFLLILVLLLCIRPEFISLILPPEPLLM